ncbi:unnamed protein product [Tuber aestivum]|uniref:Biogenesis of lysosome-related organelles complex 1 subunit KXD1 n=1 Tax=Tuber aestivum TaxID=59557 RepID=A0A292Q9B2_9PEZI|nr:unnamed protein product [Tuber aestivum]
MNDRYTSYPQDRDLHHHHRHAPTSRAPSYSLPSYPGVPPKQIPHHHHHSSSSSSTSPGIADATPIRYPGYAHGPPSLSTSSISSSSYAGSADGENGDGDVDLVALLTERLAGAFDPLQLDRSLAVQAQTSGMLNSKTRELIALQEEAQARLAETRRCFLEGMKVAKEVKSDLDYVHRKVKVLKQKTQRKYPVEYDMARDRIPPTTQ